MEQTNIIPSLEETGDDTLTNPCSGCPLAPSLVGEAGPYQEESIAPMLFEEAGLECVPSCMMTPTKTIQTVETIVSTNKVSIYSKVETPKVGMVFKSMEDVESYYKQYAEQKGFGVTRAQGYNSKKDKQRRGTTWRCECWGHPDMRARREEKKRAKAMDVSGTGGTVDGVIGDDELSRGKRTSKKCDCAAKLYASVNPEGLWVLRKAVVEHNHYVSPSKAKLVKEYRMKHYTTNVKKKLIDYFEEGVKVSQIHGCLGMDKDDEDNVPTVKDLQHEIYKERKARLQLAGGDSAAMMEYFVKMQADNSNFFHTHRLDADGRMKDVMWVDARSRAAYEYFGDVVCLDATYLTNEYELPFINVVGVNHHGQSILLGCALVSHEDTNTYAWFIRQWLACMGNKPPDAILTDQAAAIRKGLQLEMPTARHRWCIWHIMRKIPEKLSKCEGYAKFKSPLKAIVYESFTVEEFESRWKTLIELHKLEDNPWLTNLFEERHMWVPCFMKEHFWAGMKTTQRVESINSFFDGFVNRSTMMFEFPIKYTRAMTKRVKDETNADARCSKYLRRLVSGFKVEEFFQKIYTDAKFQEIQIECSRMMYVNQRGEHMVEDNVVEYTLEDRVWIIPEGSSEEKLTERRRYYRVTFNAITKEVICECRKFETFGILCKHSIRVLDQNRVNEIPQKYVLDRWRKDVVRKHTRVKVPYYDPTETIQVRQFNKMMTLFESVCDEASTADEATVNLVLNRLNQLSIDVRQSKLDFQKKQLPPPSMPNNANISPSGIGSNNPEINPTKPHNTGSQNQKHGCIKDPKSRKRPRGRPKATRYKTLAEMGYKQPKNAAPAGPQKNSVKRKLPMSDDNPTSEDWCVNLSADGELLDRNGVGCSSMSQLI